MLRYLLVSIDEQVFSATVDIVSAQRRLETVFRTLLESRLLIDIHVEIVDEFIRRRGPWA